MKKNNLGNLFILLLVFMNLAIWLTFPPIPDGRPTYARIYAGDILGSTVIILMACALFLSTRPKWAEPFFGGLDKMYMTHKRVAVSAFMLLFVHLLTVPISVQNLRLGNYLAMIAFLGIVTLVLVTLSPRIPILSRLTNASYDGWRKVHRFMGIFYALGFFHSLTVDALKAPVPINWLTVIFYFGLACYLYTEVFGGIFKKRHKYIVETVNHPNHSTTEIVLRAQDKNLTYRSGQFLFIRFPEDKVLDEPHPFTISSAPSETSVRVTVKAVGDFTRYLFSNLKEGMRAVIEGGHGEFNYKRGGEKQIWLAGGIGITPFLSFLRDMKSDLKHDVHFYYTVRTKEEALFVDEIETVAKQNPRLKPHVRFSATDGSLTIDHIVENAGGNVSGHHVYMCGPFPMVKAFEEKFLALGLPGEHIHYEEFNFR
jgi:predicted ferric reductase